MFIYGLGVFHNKNSSLLTCDDKREQPTVKENAKCLYHVQNIPCDTSLRSIIDLVPTKHILSLFPALFAYCQRCGKLKHFQYFKEGYLAPIIGTQTFTSKSISCKNCCTKNADNPKINNYFLSSVIRNLSCKRLTLKLVSSDGYHFIAVSKDSDHEALLDNVDDLDREGKIRRFTYTVKRGHRHSFRYVNDVPLNKSYPDFLVNYVDYVETDWKRTQMEK